MMNEESPSHSPRLYVHVRIVFAHFFLGLIWFMNHTQTYRMQFLHDVLKMNFHFTTRNTKHGIQMTIAKHFIHMLKWRK